MRLIDLFDIIYVDEVIQIHLEDKINNIKIHNFLNLNRNLTNQFLLIISKNIIYNKSYNKIKLEFHNSNLNSNLIGNIFEKIQELVGVQEINEFNDVIENDENVILYQSNYDVDDGVDGVGEDGGDDGYGEDAMDNKAQELFGENEYLFEKAKDSGLELISLTATSYNKIKKESIFATI